MSSIIPAGTPITGTAVPAGLQALAIHPTDPITCHPPGAYAGASYTAGITGAAHSTTTKATTSYAATAAKPGASDTSATAETPAASSATSSTASAPLGKTSRAY